MIQSSFYIVAIISASARASDKIRFHLLVFIEMILLDLKRAGADGAPVYAIFVQNGKFRKRIRI